MPDQQIRLLAMQVQYSDRPVSLSTTSAVAKMQPNRAVGAKVDASKHLNGSADILVFLPGRR
jgi:hypothetical protein